MGYYSVLNFEPDNAFINKTKEQELKKEIKDNCNTGFDEVELIIDEDGKLTDIYFDDYDRKFYDDEIFANILCKLPRPKERSSSHKVKLQILNKYGPQFSLIIYD